MVAEDLELTVETLRCREDREASGLVKKVRQFFTHQSDLVNLSNKTNIDFFQSSADLQIWHFTSHIIVFILLFAWYWNPRNPSDRWEILFGLQSASSTDDFQRDRIRIQIRWADTFTFCIYFDFLFPVDLLLFYFHFHYQSPRTPNRSASTTDVESHTESDAERGEVTLVCFKLLTQIIILKNIFQDVFQHQLKGTSFFQTPDEGSIPPSIVVSQPPS